MFFRVYGCFHTAPVQFPHRLLCRLSTLSHRCLSFWMCFLKAHQKCGMLDFWCTFRNASQMPDLIEVYKNMGNPHKKREYTGLHQHCRETTPELCESTLIIKRYRRICDWLLRVTHPHSFPSVVMCIACLRSHLQHWHSPAWWGFMYI